jgi:hypothetical protein
MEEATSVGATPTKVVNTMTGTITVGNITTEDGKNTMGVRTRSDQVIRSITRMIMAEAMAVITTGTDLPDIVVQQQTYCTK